MQGMLKAGTFVDTQADWPKERVGGWGPGQYFCRCQSCRGEYMGDKRSWHCYPCAKKASEDVIANNVGSGI